MSATQSQAAKGTVLQVSISSVFTPIIEQMKIDGPNEKLGLIECTNHDSPGFAKESIPGKVEAGTISCEGNYIPAAATGTQQVIRLALRSRTLLSCKLVRSDTGAETEAFSAYVTGFAVDQDFSKQFAVKFSLEITGQLTTTGT